MGIWDDINDDDIIESSGHLVYDDEQLSDEDIRELIAESRRAYKSKPEIYPGKERLTIIHTGMLDDRLKLIKKKVERTTIKLKKKVLKKEAPEEILQRLEQEISDLEHRISSKGDDTK